MSSGTDWVGKTFQAALDGNVSLVALGEVSHGGYEPLAFKAKMVQYLVLARGFRKLLVELPETGKVALLRKYLNDGKAKDLTTIDTLLDRIGLMPSGRAAMGELFRWIKQYNLANSTDKVMIHGFDLDTDVAARESFLYRYIIPNDPAAARQLLFQWGRRKYGDGDKLISMEQWLQSRKQALTEQQGQEVWMAMSQQLEAQRHALQYSRLMQKEGQSMANIYRDSVIARNVITQAGAEKAIVWAHNGHLYAMGQCMGRFLQQHYQNKYYIILTDFSEQARLFTGKEKGSGELTERFFPSYPNSLASQVAKKFNVGNGVLFQPEIKRLKLGSIVNDVDNSGQHGWTDGANSYHALVVFKTISTLPAR